MMRALLLATCTLLGAQAPDPAPAPQAGPRAERLARKLNLSDDQRQKLQAIRARQRQEAQARLPELKARHQALREAMRDPATSESELRRRFDAANDARFRMLLARRAARQEMQAVLTPEQRAQAAQLRERFHARQRARMRERLERRLQRMDGNQDR
ncbi:MAG TPA: Spy/CpxP family protein refolding chaperone [Holophagaceae bacterium]|nr:Spy/CpxP family protein refolding chaperone [Holophagaceae bacterium]